MWVGQLKDGGRASNYIVFDSHKLWPKACREFNHKLDDRKPITEDIMHHLTVPDTHYSANMHKANMHLYFLNMLKVYG